MPPNIDYLKQISQDILDNCIDETCETHVNHYLKNKTEELDKKQEELYAYYKYLSDELYNEDHVEYKDLYDFTKLKTEILPPWIVFPSYSRASAGWRQGYGEGYLIIYYAYRNYLSEEELKEYDKKYPIPDYFWSVVDIPWQ